jgi:hypothetical protein
MDAFARGLKIAAAIRKDGRPAQLVKPRYASWDCGLGRDIEKGRVGFRDLSTYMLRKGEADAMPAAGRNSSRTSATSSSEIVERLLQELKFRQFARQVWGLAVEHPGLHGPRRQRMI